MDDPDYIASAPIPIAQVESWIKARKDGATDDQRRAGAEWLLSLENATQEPGTKAWKWVSKYGDELKVLRTTAADGKHRKFGGDGTWEWTLYDGAYGILNVGNPTNRTNPINSVTDFLGWLTSEDTWVRIGKFSIGTLLIGVGIVAVFKVPVTPAGVARKVLK